MSEPIQISESAYAAANSEVHEVKLPIGYHVQKLLNAETEKLRKEIEDFEALKKYIEQDRGCVRDE